MYEEIRPTLSILSMSNNSETMFLTKNDDQLEESSKFNILKRPSLEFQDQSHVQAEFRIMNIAAAASVPDPINEVVQVQEEEEEEEGKCFVDDEIRKSSFLGEIKVTKDDEDDNNNNNNDGFRTPTSLDHKIPAMTQCPPAPRKPKLPHSIISSPSRKRKLSLRRVLDFSKEVESLFLPRDDVFATISRIIKKARSVDDDVTDN